MVLFLQNSKGTTYVVFSKDHDGMILLQFCKFVLADSMIHAESLAVREGILLSLLPIGPTHILHFQV